MLCVGLDFEITQCLFDRVLMSAPDLHVLVPTLSYTIIVDSIYPLWRGHFPPVGAVSYCCLFYMFHCDYDSPELFQQAFFGNLYIYITKC